MMGNSNGIKISKVKKIFLLNDVVSRTFVRHFSVIALMRDFPNTIVFTTKPRIDAICAYVKARLRGEDNSLKENPHMGY